MNVKLLMTQAFRSLQEDEDDPQFWEQDEILEYAYEGFRDILKRTEINLTERAIPLYAQVESYDEETGDPVFESFDGYYSPPIAQVQRVVGLFWKGEISDDGEANIHKLEIKTLEQMDKIDSSWRTYEGNGIPRYAVQFAGDFNNFNMQVDPFRNRLKYKLYPTPTTIDAGLQTALYNMQGEASIDNYSANDGYGGLASDDGPGIAWGLDTDGDGEIDNGVVEGSTATGIITGIQNGTFDISEYGNYPIIRYQPDIEPDILYRLSAIGVLEYSELDSMLPRDLQFAIRDYMIYRCFDKEGEAQDDKKADRYKTKYDNYIFDYQVENHLLDTERVTCDSNYSFGLDTNRPNGTGIGFGYDPLRL